MKREYVVKIGPHYLVSVAVGFKDGERKREYTDNKEFAFRFREIVAAEIAAVWVGGKVVDYAKET